ncbi:MAG: radical SAM protein [Chloroflexota bacterium]
MNFIKQLFTKVEPLPEGTHHMQAQLDEKPYRLHLRLRADGSALLVVNASTVLHLNPSAAEYAYHFVRGSDPIEAAGEVASRYRIPRKQAQTDYLDFVERIHTLISTPDLDPVAFLDFEQAAPYSADLSTPLRLDCALTYRLPEGSSAEHAPVKRVECELSTEEWKSILDKAWRAGIPHVTFTGGEPTLREDLPRLIAHAETNGQVCGLLTDGLKLIDRAYLDLLLQTGLDHVLLILQPELDDSWRAIATILPEDLFLTVHVTVNPSNAPEMPLILDRLAALGVKSLSLSFSASIGEEAQSALRDTAADLAFTLRWDLPVPYSEANPVALETKDDKIPSGAGRAWMYVEPDGDLLPTQGASETVLGNLLRDPWETIRS